MKKLLSLSLVILSVAASAQAPAKLLDVRNGNGIVDAGVTQAQATYIAYKDVASKQDVIDALCDLGNYDALPVATRPSRHCVSTRKRHSRGAGRAAIRQRLENGCFDYSPSIP